MISYIGEKLMGSFLSQGQVQKKPIKPYDGTNEPYDGCGLGDIPLLNIDDVSFGNTPPQETNTLKWHEFEVNGEKRYICDRVIFNCDDIDSYGEFLTGKTITIDEKKYTMRALTMDELDSYIVNTDRIYGLPVFAGSGEIDPIINDVVKNSNHNLFWNWVGMGTVLQDSNVCGYFSPEYELVNKELFNMFGYRPTLEILKEYPVITGEDGNLGLFNEPFVYKYSVSSFIDNDTVIIKEKINGEVINTFTKSGKGILYEGEIDLGDYWNKLISGHQMIEIEAINKNNITTTKVAMFNTPTVTYIHKEGLEYLTQELWNTKIKPFVKRQSGLVLDSGEPFTGTGVLEVENLADNGTCISGSINSTSNIIAKFKTDALKLGEYGVALRVNLSNVGIDANTIQLNVYNNNGQTSELIATRNFKSNSLKVANVYQNLYMGFDYNSAKNANSKLEFELKTLTCSIQHKIKLDYILISPRIPSVFI